MASNQSTSCSLTTGQEVEFTLLWTEGPCAGFTLQVKGHICAFRKSGEVVIKLDPMCEAACMWKKDTYKVNRKELEGLLSKLSEEKNELFSALDRAATPTSYSCINKITRDDLKKLFDKITTMEGHKK